MICLALPHVQSFALPVDIVEGEMRNLAGSQPVGDEQQ